jgi:hypothetical protein
MPKRFVHAVIVALRAFRSVWKTNLLPASIYCPSRPVWDNGINYDIPTFLRRRAG